MTRRRDERRRFLRGLGVTLSLPWLESFRGWAAEPASPLARAERPPRRFACLFMANGVHPADWGAEGNGPQMTLRKSLEPLEGLKEHLLVLDGLYHPQAAHGNVHLAAAPNVLSGAHVAQSTSDLHVGTSFDQVLAAELGSATEFPSLVLGIEPPTLGTHKGYSCIYSGHVSWSTPRTPVPRENDPRSLYDRLVGDPHGRRRAQSVLDLVLEDAKSLAPRLSAGDRQRLDQYLASVREVEQRLARAPRTTARPGPKVGDLVPRPGQEPPASVADHMRLMLDLLAVAFAVDATRVGTLMFNNDLSRMDFGFLRPGSADLTNMHGMSHAGGADYALMNRFHVGMYAYFLERLKGFVEGESTVLDNSCAMFCSSLMAGGAHDRTRLPVLLAGRLGGDLATGRSLSWAKSAEEKRRMCNLFVALGRRYGLRTPGFGDGTEPLGEL